MRRGWRSGKRAESFGSAPKGWQLATHCGSPASQTCRVQADVQARIPSGLQPLPARTRNGRRARRATRRRNPQSPRRSLAHRPNSAGDANATILRHGMRRSEPGSLAFLNRRFASDATGRLDLDFSRWQGRRVTPSANPPYQAHGRHVPLPSSPDPFDAPPRAASGPL